MHNAIKNNRNVIIKTKTHALRCFKHLLKTHNTRMMHFLQRSSKVTSKLNEMPKTIVKMGIKWQQAFKM